MALRKFGAVVQILETKSPFRGFKRGYYLYSPEPIHPLPDRTPDLKTADEAVQVVQSGESLCSLLLKLHFNSTCLECKSAVKIANHKFVFLVIKCIVHIFKYLKIMI